MGESLNWYPRTRTHAPAIPLLTPPTVQQFSPLALYESIIISM